MAITKKRKSDPLFDPRSCTYRLSRKMRDRVEELTSSNEVEDNTKSVLTDIMEEDEANKNALTYDSLVELHKYIARADKEFTDPFYLFLEDCKCIEPKARDNKQLDARLKKLRLQSSQAMYVKMTASVDRVSERKVEQMADQVNLLSNIYSNSNNDNNFSGQDQSSEFKKLNRPLTAVINSFLIFICTFIFFYKALEYALPQPNITAQVLFGLGGSSVVAIAELYFLARVI